VQNNSSAKNLSRSASLIFKGFIFLALLVALSAAALNFYPGLSILPAAWGLRMSPYCTVWQAVTDAQVKVGPGESQLVEEDLRHPVVVVLAAVDELPGETGSARLARGGQGAHDRGDLHEVGAGAGDEKQLHRPRSLSETQGNPVLTNFMNDRNPRILLEGAL